MSALTEIMDEIAATLVSDLSALEGLQVTSRMNFNPTPPSIDVYPGDPFREEDGAGFGDVNGTMVFTVRARVTTADNQAGQEVLLDLMDDESDNCVAGALIADQTLNGKAASLDVEGPSGFTSFTDSGNAGALLGVTWRVIVLNAVS